MKRRLGQSALALVVLDVIVSLLFGAGLVHAITTFDAVHTFDTVQCKLGKSDPGYCRNIADD